MKNVKLKKQEKINIKQKIKKYREMIEKTILSVQKHKKMNIISSKELNMCLKALEEKYESIELIEVSIKEKDIDKTILQLQELNNDMSCIFKMNGTEKLSDLLEICCGSSYLSLVGEIDLEKWNLLEKYTHPINYKVLNWRNEKKEKKPIAKNRIVEDFMIVDRAISLDCYDLARTSNKFQTKVYGIKIAFQNHKSKQTLIVSCIVEPIILSCYNNIFISKRLKSLIKKKPKEVDFQTKEFDNFINILSLKDYLIYSNDELYNKFVGFINQLNLNKKKTISQTIKDFLSSTLYQQRTNLMQLLISHENPENQYMAYLLYDLLSNENNGSIDSYEQTILFDSLPWYSKKHFNLAMSTTMNYTNSLSNFDTNKIPIEQQICLLKASENVKQKAMIKLKEVKSKSEDSGSKARQFLEALLKIPFGIYKKEKILTLSDTIKDDFKNILNKLEKNKINFLTNKTSYSNYEIIQNIKKIKSEYFQKIKDENVEKIKKMYTTGKKEILVSNICYINSVIKKNNMKISKLTHSGKKNGLMKKYIIEFLNKYKNNKLIMNEIIKRFIDRKGIIEELDIDIQKIENTKELMNNYIKNVRKNLDKSVHGHENAKRQIERIIGQWISGKQTGYCFGFEGAPGIGKTSLAKHGLSSCLVDEDGQTRPFAFIALGGSCNGSTIAGHNYTYVGSTWGKIVDILIEKKCMNPIIFIDELDKVSNTEHGREIIGILTHLIDTTQNDKFEDKYFSGIGLNLSKALFIFSYNDVSAIDKVLLDRIHRIKFECLTVKEKIEITKKYLLPEIYKNMGLENTLNFSNEVICYIIERYTKEAGVRKLKEILFEIISEINLELLEDKEEITLPLVLNIDDIKYKYLKERHEVNYIKIAKKNAVGIINGLWANAVGMGGIIQIECKYFPTKTLLDLKLTGMQGDVMKESMNVAKTLSWNLCTNKVKKKILGSNLGGVHIHCPEGSVPKDGPSAGTAITVAIYSLFMKKEIPNHIGITGEINLSGMVTQIGGLELKILGGIRGGITKFIFPLQNKKDFNKINEKYKDTDKFKDITFKMVENINDVVKEIF
jgi:ATP-dependent Lon protease